MRLLDLFAGSCAVSKAFAARGWECVCVDIVAPAELPERCFYEYAELSNLNLAMIRLWEAKYGAFDFIWASSPCDDFSVHGMKHYHPNPPYPDKGIMLFESTRSTCEWSRLPYVMENVRAAQQFVGRAVHHCGPFYLWGNAVPPILPQGVSKGISQRVPNMKNLTRAEITAWRREHDPMWSSSKGEKRRKQTANAARIPLILANCVADYAERLLEGRAA